MVLYPICLHSVRDESFGRKSVKLKSWHSLGMPLSMDCTKRRIPTECEEVGGTLVLPRDANPNGLRLHCSQNGDNTYTYGWHFGNFSGSHTTLSPPSHVNAASNIGFVAYPATNDALSAHRHRQRCPFFGVLHRKHWLFRLVARFRTVYFKLRSYYRNNWYIENLDKKSYCLPVKSVQRFLRQ